MKSFDVVIIGAGSAALQCSGFVLRLWMRRIIKAFTNQGLLELCFAFLRGRIGQKFAKHVFFGRGSFPVVEVKQTANALSVKSIG